MSNCRTPSVEHPVAGERNRIARADAKPSLVNNLALTARWCPIRGRLPDSELLLEAQARPSGMNGADTGLPTAGGEQFLTGCAYDLV
ncbi:hypothetical protein [Kitasatospora purpeofusca]|uniref:Uncharacterized protein n=1 Tax=Kitasatospora purpeofusca TaxID=67352 RepID=A0ABZ1TWK3_9ACTN|nr:hypothetical protein [Kitasatospora purpeofusca]